MALNPARKGKVAVELLEVLKRSGVAAGKRDR